jgi:diguanylate cyclase (GGDEF)-like protein
MCLADSRNTCTSTPHHKPMKLLPRPPLSLRTALIVPYVALVLGLAVAIGVLSWRAGSNAVETVSAHLLLETVSRIGQAVDRHIVGSSAVLEAAFPNGMPAPSDIAADAKNLRTRFWIATSLHTDPNNYVYYGNRAGQGIGLFRRSATEGELRIKTRAEDTRTYYRFSGIDGELKFHSREAKLFDPRQRPWYKAGEAAGSDIWTAVYIDFGTQDLVATRARRVLSAKGELEGVVATDISLRALNEFVRNLKVSPNGVAFIIEPSGDLIASSASPNVKRMPDGSSLRMKPAESGNPLLTAINAEVQASLSRQASLDQPQTFSFSTDNGEQIRVAYDLIRDYAGLKWITVVAVPRSDVMTGVTENIARTAVLGVLAALLAVFIGMRIVVWVTRDLQQLSEAARKIGAGDLNTPLSIVRQDEIGELSQSFKAMQIQLQTDQLTGLANRDAFMRRVQALIANSGAKDGAAPFAILFVDLNHFKQVNDQLGHDMGDRVLVEVSERLRGGVRGGDVVARYAGDEFVILMEGIKSPEAVAVIRTHLEAQLSGPLRSIEGLGHEIVISAAVGASFYPDDGDTAEDLIKSADRRMYVDKANCK